MASPPRITVDKLTKFRHRAIEVVNLIDNVYPSAEEVAERVRDVACSDDPWQALSERRSLTSVAARLSAASNIILGLRIGAGKGIFWSLYADVAMSAALATPGIRQSGISSAAALAAGIQAGGGQATASMTGLMGSLAAIAAGGVTVPVKLDTAGAEAQLSSLMSRSLTPSLKGAGNSGRFSKSLSDIGSP